MMSDDQIDILVRLKYGTYIAGARAFQEDHPELYFPAGIFNGDPEDLSNVVIKWIHSWTNN